MKKIRKMLKRQEGFTLVELMVAVVILGILAGIGVQQYGRIQRQAQIAAHNANVRIITNAANMYIMMNNEVPEGGIDIDDLVTQSFLQAAPKPPQGLDYAEGGTPAVHSESHSSRSK
ncbi:MAG: competence type IV pilus major pilin ComGC [Limnochordia bacterium]